QVGTGGGGEPLIVGRPVLAQTGEGTQIAGAVPVGGVHLGQPADGGQPFVRVALVQGPIAQVLQKQPVLFAPFVVNRGVEGRRAEALPGQEPAIDQDFAAAALPAPIRAPPFEDHRQAFPRFQRYVQAVDRISALGVQRLGRQRGDAHRPAEVPRETLFQDLLGSTGGCHYALSCRHAGTSSLSRRRPLVWI